MISDKKITQDISSIHKVYKKKTYKTLVDSLSEFQRIGSVFKINDSQNFFFQNSSVPSLIVAANSLITNINAAGAALFEIAADELINSNLKKYLSSESGYLIDNLISNTLHSNCGESCYITLHTDSRHIPVQVKSAIIPGSYECIFEMIRQPELEKAGNSSDKFLSLVAHDLKNPFNSILGFSELLLKNIRNYSYDDIERFVGIISETSQRTYQLLENFLLWSRSQSGSLEFNPDVYNLSNIVGENIENIRHVAARKQLTIHFVNNSELQVFTDKKMLNIILTNILSNAVKYSKTDNSIDVEVFENESRGVVLVNDYGEGMEPATLDRLFRMESKFSMPGTLQERGSGLGLLISKELIIKNSGSLEVYSEFGKGTQVVISLPKAAN